MRVVAFAVALVLGGAATWLLTVHRVRADGGGGPAADPTGAARRSGRPAPRPEEPPGRDDPGARGATAEEFGGERTGPGAPASGVVPDVGPGAGPDAGHRWMKDAEDEDALLDGPSRPAPRDDD